MNYADFSVIYNEILKLNNLDEYCTQDIAVKMHQMVEYMLEINEHMNLTAITEPEDVVLKHLADCLTVSKFIPQNSNVCDIGCGGGFPSLPLAIARSDLTIVGIDSTEKRINYVNDSARKLGLKNLKAIAGRAEELSRTGLRESFDACVARAVANLPVLSELCIPFVKVNGQFIAMKGRLTPEENADNAVQILGCKLLKADTVYLKNKDLTEQRNIIIYKKTTATPNKYPRLYSQIKKKPL